MAGCENLKVMSTGALLGVRESRRIVGEYELNYADFQARLNTHLERLAILDVNYRRRSQEG